MIKELTTILSNDINNNELNLENIIELINNDYSESFENYLNHNYLYRGDSRNFKATIIKSHKRKSLDNSSINFYNTLLSNLPSWKKYPKRNKCIICTNEVGNAVLYGICYVIFPKNGTKIAICPSNDIWGSFRRNDNIKSLTRYERNINTLYQHIFDTKDDGNFNSKNDIIKFCNKIDEIKKNKELKYNTITKLDFISFIDSIMDFKGSTFDYFDENFNPLYNDFKLTTINNLPNVDIRGDNELWFDNDALAIEYNYFQTISKDFLK